MWDTEIDGKTIIKLAHWSKHTFHITHSWTCPFRTGNRMSEPAGTALVIHLLEPLGKV